MSDNILLAAVAVVFLFLLAFILKKSLKKIWLKTLLFEGGIETHGGVGSHSEPSVMVSMVKPTDTKGTCFYFRNRSGNPIRVWLEIELEIDGKRVGPKKARELLDNDRLTGRNFFPVEIDYRTSYQHLEKLMDNYSANEIKATLKIFTATTSEKRKPRTPHNTRAYHYQKNNPQWINEIGVPDPAL